MRAIRAVIVAFTLLVAGLAHAGDALQEAYDLLVKTDQVTTESVGLAGDVSAEARAFHAVFTCERAADKLRTLYDKAKTPAGRIWALIGLRELKDKRYEDLEKDFLGKDQPRIKWASFGVAKDDQDPRELLKKLLAEKKSLAGRIVGRVEAERRKRR